MTDQDRIRLAEMMGWTPYITEYEYHWATNRRKSCGDADWYFHPPKDEPDYQGWENIEDHFWRDDHTDNYHFRRKLPKPIQDGWLNPDNKKRTLPDPFTNANDCEALIQHLLGLGWYFEMHMQPTNDENMAAGAWLEFWQAGTEIHHRIGIDVDRWKTGVCELALKIDDD